MNSTATLSSPRAFTGGVAAAPLTRREEALVAERAEALQRADKAAHALEQIRSNRCGASCLRDLVRTVALLLMVFCLPALLLLSAQVLPKGNVLAASMAAISMGWIATCMAMRRFMFERG